LTSRTSFEIRAAILAELFVKHKKDPTFSEFREYADLGLPLAYTVSNGIVPSTEKAQKYIEDAFEGLLEILEIPEDEGFKDLDDLLAESSWEPEG
jgi:hypothetical protein